MGVVKNKFEFINIGFTLLCPVYYLNGYFWTNTCPVNFVCDWCVKGLFYFLCELSLHGRKVYVCMCLN